MGGMAIRAHAPDWPARTRRVEVDLDFATRGKDRGAFYELLAREGYTADKRHNALFGGKQAYFVDVPRHRPVDVLVDSLEMCHRFEFADRLAKSTPTLPLAELLLSKLQIVKINRKDVLDALVLLAEHPLAQDDGARRRPTRPGRHQRPAHPVVHLERLGLVADGDRQPRHARPVPRGRAHAGGPRPRQRPDGPVRPGAPRSPPCATAIDDAPKSTRWKLRSRVGERQAWYKDPEEMGHN